ncbi:MAG: hypothetical protein GY906_05060, partial [bacterium]|nr:hypothetical protein [bacterium]
MTESEEAPEPNEFTYSEPTARLRHWLIATLTVTGLTIVTWMVAYLALVDIWHGQEPDFSGEWLATYAALIALTIC